MFRKVDAVNVSDPSDIPVVSDIPTTQTVIDGVVVHQISLTEDELKDLIEVFYWTEEWPTTQVSMSVLSKLGMPAPERFAGTRWPNGEPVDMTFWPPVKSDWYVRYVERERKLADQKAVELVNE